jgi:hypothetical protein
VQWGYTFEAVDEGTRVEETWQIIDTYDGLEAQDEEFLRNLPGWTKRNIETTLSNMKARFEAAPT